MYIVLASYSFPWSMRICWSIYPCRDVIPMVSHNLGCSPGCTHGLPTHLINGRHRNMTIRHVFNHLNVLYFHWLMSVWINNFIENSFILSVASVFTSTVNSPYAVVNDIVSIAKIILSLLFANGLFQSKVWQYFIKYLINQCFQHLRTWKGKRSDYMFKHLPVKVLNIPLCIVLI